MKRIYLASRYDRREELCKYRKVLEADGYIITAKWLNGNHMLIDAPEHSMYGYYRDKYAQEDLENILGSDTLIAFTEEEQSGLGRRGGRHVELGFAIAAMKKIILIGPRENIFCWLKDIQQFDTFEFFMLYTHQFP